MYTVLGTAKPLMSDTSEKSTPYVSVTMTAFIMLLNKRQFVSMVIYLNSCCRTYTYLYLINKIQDDENTGNSTRMRFRCRGDSQSTCSLLCQKYVPNV